MNATAPQLRGILASVLFVLLAVSVSENAAADSETGVLGGGFHCPSQPNLHVFLVDGTNACTGSNAILLDRHDPPRSGACGECQPISALTGAGNYDSSFTGSNPNTGRFSFYGENYFNADRSDNDNVRRTNEEFCEQWLGGEYGDFLSRCECPDGEAPLGNHGACQTNPSQACYDANFRRPLSDGSGGCREAEENDADRLACTFIDPYPQTSGIPSPFEVPGGLGDVLNGACAVDNSVGFSNCPGSSNVRLIPEVAGHDSRNLVGTCVGASVCQNTYNGVADGGMCRAPNSSRECRDNISAQTPIFENNACRAATTNADCAGVFSPDLPIRDADGSCRVPASSAECREGVSAQTPIFENNACRAAATNADCAGVFSPDLPIRNTDGSCRAPTSSAECREDVSAQTPIFENNACRAAATDADCAGVFTPDLPIMDADGSCRLPAGNAECAGLNAGAEPIHDANEPDNCRARNTGDCPGQILEAGACQACPTGQTPNSAQTACECDSSTHVDVNEGVAPLDCRPRCQTGQLRDTQTMDCRPITAQDCLGQTPPQFLAQNGRCQSCRMPETPNDQGTACICPTSTHEEIDGACLELCDMTTEIRNTDGECVPRVRLSSCDPNEHLVANACVECPVNQFRGTEQNCAPCPIANQTRPENAAMCSCPSSSHFDNAAEGTCDEIPECDQASEVLDQEANECVPLSSCTPPRMIQETGVCAEDVRCPEPNQERDEATNRCVCESGHREQTDGSCEPICGPNQIQENNACVCAEGFMDSAPSPVALNCILACDGTGERRISDAECGCMSGYDRIGNECRVACGPNQRRNPDANNLCACAPGYANVLGTPEELDCRLPCPTGQTHNLASGTCEAIRCPTGQDLVGNACVPGCRADQTRTNGACECPSANPVEYRGACVQECSSGETRNASGACVSQGSAAPSPAGSSQGTDSDGGDNKETVANILIGAPIAAVWGYLLFAPHFVDQQYDLTFHGENEDFHYQGNAEFHLKHGNFRSYAGAVQTDGNAISYEAGMAFETDNFALAYAALESQSEYDYDLNARLHYKHGPWTISPVAAAEFQYRTEKDWNAEASAGVSAAWTAHRWIVKAQSDFAGENRHRLEIRRDL